MGIRCRAFGAIVAVAWSLPTAAQVVVGPGATFDLGGGRLVLADRALQVDGAMALGTGLVDQVGDVRIGPAGMLLGEGGRLRTGGGWHNDGMFDPGSSRVSFVDGISASAALTGQTTFHELELLAASARTVRLEAGATQRVLSSLHIRGTPEAPLQVASTAVGQAAFLHLVPSGSQDIGYVGVSDVHATGAWLAPGQINRGGTGNALRWFGSGPLPPQLIPVGRGGVAWLLAGLLALFAHRAIRSRSVPV